MGLPDMRLPIQYALGYPERLPQTMEAHSDLVRMSPMTYFEAPAAFEDFPVSATGLPGRAAGRCLARGVGMRPTRLPSNASWLEIWRSGISIA